MKVCSIVLNAISHDARVLKEADTLRRAGHDVTLVGVTDQKVTARRETLDNGVKIIRVDSNALKNFVAVQLIGSVYIALTLVVLLAALTLHRGVAIGLLIAGTVALLAHLALVPIRLRRRVYLGMGEKVERPAALQSTIFTPTASAAGKIAYVLRMLGAYFVVTRLAPDVVHCHDAITLPIGVAAKRKLKCLLVYDAHEIYEEVAQASPARAKVYRRIHKTCQGYVDGFVTINRSIAGWYADHYPRLPQAVVIKNATNMAGPIEYDGRLHAAANLPGERKVLLYQGGFSRKRGLEYLVESARYLNDDWALVMMGWGTLEAELRAVANTINTERRTLGKPDAVVFIPAAPQRELAYWTAGGTVGIIPYEKIGLNHWFCTPNKLWEYPNASLPVLVSPFPELSAPVLEYGYGWLLPETQDPQALGEMVVSLTDEQIAQARANCMKFMQADNWQTYAAKLVELYRDLVARHGVVDAAAHLARPAE